MSDPLIIYLHLPKSAGTTLEQFFYTLYVPGPGPFEEEVLEAANGYVNYGLYHFRGGFYGEGDTIDDADLAPVLQRPDIRVAMGHFMFGVHRLQSRPVVYVTLLREPVSRVVSFAYHHLSWEHGDPQRSVSAERLEAYLAESTLLELDNGQTRRIAGVDLPFGSLTAETLELAKRNLAEYFSAVGLTERFDESLVLFAQALGWPRDDTYFLPHQVSPGRPSISSAARELAAERNSLDIELYRYAETLFEERLQGLGDIEAELVRLASAREKTKREWGHLA